MHDDDIDGTQRRQAEIARLRRELITVLALICTGSGYLIATLASSLGVTGFAHGAVLLVALLVVYAALRVRPDARKNRNHRS
jgi:uncharacterized membrane protein